MPQAKILSLVPYIAVIDVTIEVPLVSATLTLCFGPFNAREDGEEWAVEVERLHKRIEKIEAGLADAVRTESELPTGAFVRSYIGVPDVILAGVSAREPGALIPVHVPEIDARDLHVYALRALECAVEETLLQLNRTLSR